MLSPKFKNDEYYLSKSIILLPFYLYTFGGREGVCKESMFCTLVKMMKKGLPLFNKLYNHVVKIIFVN